MQDFFFFQKANVTSKLCSQPAVNKAISRMAWKKAGGCEPKNLTYLWGVLIQKYGIVSASIKTALMPRPSGVANGPMFVPLVAQTRV